MEKISERNLLKCQPILVNKEWYVIDGQHRLEAAKRLQIPISFVVDENLTLEDMATLNIASKKWAVSDYLNYYARKGFPDYLKLEDFIKKEKMQLNVAFMLFHGSKNTSFFKSFSEGKYKFPNEVEYAEAMKTNLMIKDIIDFIKRKTSGTKTYLDKVSFYGALVEFFNIKSFEYEKFKTKLELKLDFMRRCTTKTQYILLFKQIYNWKNKNPLEEDV